jgi:transmembrane sensor
MARAMAWRDGILYFENRRLEEVVAELSRYSPVHFVIDNEALRQLPIGGTFQASPQGTEAFLAMLEQGLGLKVRRDGDSIHIEPAVPNRAN